MLFVIKSSKIFPFYSNAVGRVPLVGVMFQTAFQGEKVSKYNKRKPQVIDIVWLPYANVSRISLETEQF